MYVYIIGSNPSIVKIGISKHPEKRLKQLQTGASEKLFLYHKEQVEEHLAAQIEKFIHKNLRESCSHGEWFNISKDDAISEIKYALIMFEDAPY